MPERARDRREREALEPELEHNPLRGKPLPHRIRLGKPTVEGYLTALGGPLPYMLRLREIETRTRAHEQALEEAWRALAAEDGIDADAFAARWRAVVAGWDFAAVNLVIDKHNRYYPAEARLPMDPRTGDFALVEGRDYRRAPLDAAWALERFPPTLAAAGAR
jgi:hypothetical protein